MNNKEIAQGLLRQAERRLKMAKLANTEGDFAYVVRQSQECIELALKAVLFFLGIDFPKWHDVGTVLLENRERLSMWNKETVERLASFSRNLKNERERSMYGDEELGLPPNRIYSQFDAKVALEKAEEVFHLCAKEIK